MKQLLADLVDILVSYSCTNVTKSIKTYTTSNSEKCKVVVNKQDVLQRISSSEQSMCRLFTCDDHLSGWKEGSIARIETPCCRFLLQ